MVNSSVIAEEMTAYVVRLSDRDHRGALRGAPLQFLIASRGKDTTRRDVLKVGDIARNGREFFGQLAESGRITIK